MGSRACILRALACICAIVSAHAQLYTVQRPSGRVAAAHVTTRAQASQVPLQLQDHPWMKLLKNAKRGDPLPSPSEAETRQQLQLDFARLMGEHQRAAQDTLTLHLRSTTDERAVSTAEPTGAPAQQQQQVPAQQPARTPVQSQQASQLPVAVAVGSRSSSAAAAASDRAALLEMQKHLAAQLERIEETLRRMEAADKEARAQARERAQARTRATPKALPQPQVPVVPLQQPQALPATTPQPAAPAVQESGKRAQQPLYERSLLAQQQQQQQQDPASDLPARTCRVTDSPVPGSNAMRSYGLAMVQADKLPALPSAPGSGGYAPTAGPGVSRTASRAGVLVCLVSSGVDASSPTLVNSPIAGCREEDPLDPGGCPFAWDKDATGQGTHLASVVAGSAPGANGGQQGGALGVVPGVKIYSVRVWDRSPSWRGYAGDGAFGSNRMIAYNSCEGHLRGESAQNLRRTNYRMVMLLDVQATSAAPSVSSNGVELYPSEQDWIHSAARYGDDILWVAPAGDTSAPAYPAALSAPNNRLLSVGAVGCDGKPWPAAGSSGRRIDLLAPGVEIVGAAPARGGGATLTVAPLSGGGDGSSKGEPFTLAVALQGDAAGRAETEVTLQPCGGGKCSPGDVRQACVVSTFRVDAGGAVCDALSRGACSGGIVLVPQGIEPLMGDDIASTVSRCAPWYGDSRQQSVPPRPRPPVLMAPPQAGGRLASMVAARGSAARAWLGVAAAQQAKRTGTSQAAAWVAGAASRLMARYPQCGAADVASVLMESALLLGPDGKPTGARGRGGLLQVKDAEDWLSGRACATAKEPASSGGR